MWTDALGQLPFAIDVYNKLIKYGTDAQVAAETTKKLGEIFGDGNLTNFINFFKPRDNSNNYDNEMIDRGIRWKQGKEESPYPIFDRNEKKPK